jgi:hypothetical protein
MKNAQYTPTSKVTKAAFAALAIGLVTSFAGSLKASEQNAVAQASMANTTAKMEVRIAAPILVTAKRDIRQLEVVQVIGHRSDIALVQGGKRNAVMNASPAN